MFSVSSISLEKNGSEDNLFYSSVKHQLPLLKALRFLKLSVSISTIEFDEFIITSARYKADQT